MAVEDSPASSIRSRTQRRSDKGYVGQGSFAGSVINLVNTIVGAGVLAMPHALANMGMTLGIIVIVWAGVTSGFGLYLQTRCARYVERGAASFFSLSQMTYPKASVVFDLAISLKCFGVGVSYLIIIGDLMPGVIRGFSQDPDLPGFLFNRHFWITSFMIIAIPFTFLRRLDSLKYTSVIALIAITYLVILVLAHFGMGDTLSQRGPIKYFRWGGPVDFFSSLPVMVFAYTCHQNMFSIVNEMADNSPRKTTGVVFASIGAAFSIYIIVAITGYLSFGDNVAGNIVSQYSPSVASTIGKAAIVIMVMFSYALQVHPCRASVDAVLKWRPTSVSSRRQRDQSGHAAPLLGGSNRSVPSPKAEEMSETRFAMITSAIVILSYLVAMTVSSLEKVLAYVGSTGSTSISFILPGLFYYKISSPDSPHHQRLIKQDDDEEAPDAGTSEDENTEDRPRLPFSWRRDVLRRLSLAIAIYGILVMVTCLVTNTFFIAKEG